MNIPLTAAAALQQARERVRCEAWFAAARVRDTAAQILVELDADNLSAARTRFSELAQRLPQFLAPIDEHLKEAEIVARFAANMADDPTHEATR
jgi:hypothetical protein